MPGHGLARKQGLLHWHWAFECPPVIKLMVRCVLCLVVCVCVCLSKDW